MDPKTGNLHLTIPAVASTKLKQRRGLCDTALKISRHPPNKREAVGGVAGHLGASGLVKRKRGAAEVIGPFGAYGGWHSLSVVFDICGARFTTLLNGAGFLHLSCDPRFGLQA